MEEFRYLAASFEMLVGVVIPWAKMVDVGIVWSERQCPSWSIPPCVSIGPVREFLLPVVVVGIPTAVDEVAAPMD